MIRIACFASGQGTNVLRLLEASRFCQQVSIPLLVVDQPEAPVIESVRREFPQVKIALASESDRRVREEKILAQLEEHRIDWCFLAGFMRVLSPDFIRRLKKNQSFAPIINLHPSLLPAHPGLDAIKKSFNSKDLNAGISIHLVDEGVDTGPLILQKSFKRSPNETLEGFSKKIKELEWESYPKVLQMLDRNLTLLAIVEKPSIFDQPKAQLFWVSYSGEPLTQEQWNALVPRISDPVDQEVWINPTLEQWRSFYVRAHAIDQIAEGAKIRIQSFLPGVTDNPGTAFAELLRLEKNLSDRNLEVHSGEAVLVQEYVREHAQPNPLLFWSNFFGLTDARLGTLQFRDFSPPLQSEIRVDAIQLRGLSDRELVELSQDRHWALSLDEMKVIQKEFSERALTDVEMEIIAQTWSEHCKHKLFRAEIEYSEVAHPEKTTKIQGLFKEFIQKPTTQLQAKKPWLVSVFSDNAGIVRFHQQVDVCIKVETHNSPSALDPYGGALTGILGVNRDILGTGLGARPIANTNVLCFGNPDLTEPPALGLFTPRQVLEGVHRGIQDGGNKSGIPTVNGAIYFDESYSGKPLVYCGTLGVMPQTIHGQPSHVKGQRAGDKIVVVGGSVGLDGVHGATSSSLELNESTPTGMVQIGDPLTQKRVLDFILFARDQGLFNSITDNGAGGISSSIGEMAAVTQGAKVDLSRVPLKYPGLQPWQIMVSESQERMTLSVAPEKEKELLLAAKAWGVQAVTLGEFTSSGYLEVFYHDERVAHLGLQFLHDGLPPMKLKAVWSGPRKTPTAERSLRLPLRDDLRSARHRLLALANHPTLQSKETWIRQYDHEVQAATAKKPFEGTYDSEHLNRSAPNEGGLIWMGAHGAQDASGNPTREGVGVGSGFAPHLSDFDPWWMAVCAVDEAVRNVVVLGCDPARVALTDNFCWPNPDTPQKLAELVRTCQGLRHAVLAYEMPLVSGKDSMKNDFKGKDQSGAPVQISVLPSLLVTAVAYHPDVSRTVSAHFYPGQNLYRIGRTWRPETLDVHAIRKLYSQFYEAIQKGWIESARDVSEGGLAFAVAEGLLLHECGIRLGEFQRRFGFAELFAETPGQLVIGVCGQQGPSESELGQHFGADQCQWLGRVDDSGVIQFDQHESLGISDFAAHFRRNWNRSPS